MPLTEYTDEELKQELDRRSKNIWTQFKDWLEENVDVLLAATPEHSRSSCSDTNLSNCFVPARCTRCFLLDVKESGYYNESYIPHWNPGYITFTEIKSNGNN